MKKSIFLISIALFVLVGCGGKYCHPYKTAHDFERDKYDCKMKTRSGSGEMLLVDLEYFFDCMQTEKGWYKCNQQ